MHLKRLSLKGFKSFPSKTEIEFNEGLTAVVGPNGSGKSNITDAIRWVLGEQSIKSLRGEKLEDVIFAGSENKKHMNYCEVEIILDNSDRTLDLDYSEVNIKRRAYRSGESEFFLNAKSCRLKDIKEILMDTGIGKDSYSIIGQGKMDEILSNNPTNRRRIFDEACGIAKYRYKKNETEKNLAHVSENLERINDIYYEIEKQLMPLYNQQKKAKKYMELSHELKDLEINSILRALDKNKLVMDDINGELEIRSNEKAENDKRLEKMELLIREREEDFRVHEGILKDSEHRLSESKQEIISAESQIGLSDERAAYKRTDIERIKGELSGLVQEEEDLRELKAALALEREGHIEELNTIKEELKDKGLEVSAKEFELSDEEKRLESIRNERTALTERSYEIKRSMDIERLSEKSKLERIESLRAQIDSGRISINELEKKIDEENKIISELELKQSDYEKTMNRGLDEKKALIADSERLKSSIDSIGFKIKDADSKINIYKRLENELEGYHRGVKEVLKNKGLNGIEGAIGQLFKADSGYETALEAALGGSIQNIVSTDQRAAKEAIEFLRNNKLGRVTFLPMNRVKGERRSSKELKGMKGYIAMAWELVKYDSAYKDIAGFTLGSTAVIDNIDNAIAISNKLKDRIRLVTLKGDIINTTGSMTGGSGSNTSSILSRAAMLEELKRDIEKHTLELKALNEKGMEAYKAIEHANNEINAQRELIDGIGKEILTKKIETQSLIRNLEETRTGMAELESEIKSLEESTVDIRDKYRSGEEEIGAIDNSLIKLTEDEDECFKSILRLRAESSALRESLSQINISEVKKQQTIESLDKEETRISGDIERTVSGINQRRADLDSNHRELEEIAAARVELESRVEELKSGIDELTGQIVDKRKEIAVLKAGLEEMNKEFRVVEKNGYDLKEAVFKLTAALERAENTRTIHTQSLYEKYELNILEANELRDDNLEIKKSRLGSLRYEIRALGNVNLDSIEEYERVNERYTLYKTQKEDLEKSSEALMNMIRSIEVEMVREFKESFAIISDNYSKVYKTLFGGGVGELKLENEDDVLGSDIEIFGRPPGKSTKSLNLLSGGERALTAISILFAILIAKPSPFCILDEIEAPLDDVNVARFASFLKDLSDTNQFITVTHRRGTMEEADYIYGVTMQEKGVSKIIGLNLTEAKELAN